MTNNGQGTMNGDTSRANPTMQIDTSTRQTRGRDDIQMRQQNQQNHQMYQTPDRNRSINDQPT